MHIFPPNLPIRLICNIFNQQARKQKSETWSFVPPSLTKAHTQDGDTPSNRKSRRMVYLLKSANTRTRIWLKWTLHQYTKYQNQQWQEQLPQKLHNIKKRAVMYWIEQFIRMLQLPWISTAENYIGWLHRNPHLNQLLQSLFSVGLNDLPKQYQAQESLVEA